MTEVDGVGEPGDAKFEFALGGFDIEGVSGVPGVDGVACCSVSTYFRFKPGEEGTNRSR